MATTKKKLESGVDENPVDDGGDFADAAAELATTRVIEHEGEETTSIVAREGEKPSEEGSTAPELMAEDEWREMVRFAFDMAASTGGEDMAPLMIQPDEEVAFGKATDALYRIFNRYDFTRPILYVGNNLLKDLLLVGSFAWLKVRVLAVILQHRRIAALQAAEAASNEELNAMGEAASVEL